MTDPINKLRAEGWAYAITDRRCPHWKEKRYKSDCSMCVREIIVEAIDKEREDIIQALKKLPGRNARKSEAIIRGMHPKEGNGES